ncbi:MAG: 30S ribosomal protein S12 methylthiotransferase RimO [Clostridia bacterium]|nr:30S ribosomal protein S12 methylthiotransferase RimO [Clostridia bacterium]
MKKVGFVSLGCPKNLTDTESMIGILKDTYEIVNDPMQAEIIIVNTCGFIETAKQESVDTILEMAEYKKKGNLKKLIVTGCVAEQYKNELLLEIPEADAVVGTGSYQDILLALEKAENNEKPVIAGDINGEIPENLPRVLATPSYFAYLKIAEGCDNRCTYCIIPYLRGKFRSRTEENILKEAKILAEKGVKELIIIAQDATSYGMDLFGKPTLHLLLKKLSLIEGIHKIRLLYCYPEKVTDELICEIASNPKICKYIDIPMQHASSKVLKRMGRKVTREQLVTLVEKLRSKIPDITIRTTFITGFSGETEEDFNQLKEFIEKMRFDKVGVFPFSLEEGTPAMKLDGVIPEEIRKERADALLKLQQEISYEKNKEKIGKTLEVLCTGQLRDGRYTGRTQGDAPDIDGEVIFEGDNVKLGEYVNVLILDASEYDLEGKIPYNFEEDEK